MRVFNGLFTLGVIAGAGFLGWSQLELGDAISAHQARNELFSEDGFRIPAAIRKSHDFSRLQGSALQSASAKSLLKDIRLLKKSDRFGVELGHFVVKGDDGQKEFACAFYDRVRLEFVGEGMAENGSLPNLVVDGPCQISKDIHRMRPLWLPVKKILEAHPKEFQSQFFPEEDLHVRVSHVSYQWPTEWRLKGVKVYHEQKGERSISVEEERVQKFLSHSQTMSW